MAFFPIYIDMQPLKILVVGGGAIAADKLEKLVEFSKDIAVIAEKTNSKTDDLIKEYGLTLHQRKYKEGDIQGFDMVVVATDTVDLHRAIYQESRGARILVNSVDNTAYCDFIFPSYIKQGRFNSSLFTNRRGLRLLFARRLRNYFLNKIPNNVGEFLENMKSLRTQIPKGKERMQKFDAMAKEFIEKNFKS